MSDPTKTTARTQRALSAFLIASSKHTAAMYDLGFAFGAGNPRGPAERNLEETSTAFVSARANLEEALQMFRRDSNTTKADVTSEVVWQGIMMMRAIIHFSFETVQKEADFVTKIYEAMVEAPQTTDGLTDRAKIVAQILTDNGHQVDPPDSGTLDDVELERWNVCLQIVQALSDNAYQCCICGGRVDLTDAVRPTVQIGR